MMPRRRAWASCIVAHLGFAALLLWAPAALGQSVRPEQMRSLQQREARLSLEGGWVTVSAGWRDAIDAPIRKKLLSGLPTMLLARAYLFTERGRRPVGLGVKTCRVVYDLWDEIFRVEIQEGGRVRRAVVVNVEGVLRRCGQAQGLSIVEAKELKPERPYFVGVLVEVNPLSTKMLKRIKRWVARPRGAGAVSPGNSLFGSFVGLFITKVPAADRAVAFRTARFTAESLAERR